MLPFVLIPVYQAKVLISAWIQVGIQSKGSVLLTYFQRCALTHTDTSLCSFVTDTLGLSLTNQCTEHFIHLRPSKTLDKKKVLLPIAIRQIYSKYIYIVNKSQQNYSNFVVMSHTIFVSFFTRIILDLEK